MRLVKISMTLAIVALAACAALTPQSFNEKISLGYSGVTTLADTATQLHQSGTLSDKDAKNILDQAELVKEGLDIAREIKNTDPAGGDAKLTATLAALTAAQAYLRSKHP